MLESIINEPIAELLKIFLLLFIGTVAGFINVGAGGGSILTLPVLIFLGMDGALANGTNRLSVMTQNFFAISSFRQQGMHDFKTSFQMSLFTLPGAVAGAFLSIKLDNIWFERVLAIVMIFVVLSMIFNGSRSSSKKISSMANKKILLYFSLFGIGFYGGFIQVGVGLLFLVALFHLSDMNLLHVNMHKVFIILIYTLPVLGIFIVTRNVDWGYGIILSAGTAFGAWWGARVNVQRGEKITRCVLAISVLLMSGKLLGIF